MPEDVITQGDLDWWWEFAAAREWTFARTYAVTAPHDYIVADRTPGVKPEDIVRAARVICTYGTPGKYYAVTKIYLTSPDGRHRWWTEDRHFTDATLVNRGPTDVLYGIQNAPATACDPSPHDEVATFWDAEHPVGSGDAERILSLLAPVRGKYPPHVLDVGCGTGRVLDLGLISPDRYAALDRSQAMLNLLVRKHPKVAAVYPSDIRHALVSGQFTPRQFDWVFIDGAIDVDVQQRAQLERLARLAVITIDGDEWRVHVVSAAPSRGTASEAAQVKVSP